MPRPDIPRDPTLRREAKKKATEVGLGLAPAGASADILRLGNEARMELGRKSPHEVFQHQAGEIPLENVVNNFLEASVMPRVDPTTHTVERTVNQKTRLTDMQTEVGNIRKFLEYGSWENVPPAEQTAWITKIAQALDADEVPEFKGKSLTDREAKAKEILGNEAFFAFTRQKFQELVNGKSYTQKLQEATAANQSAQEAKSNAADAARAATEKKAEAVRDKTSVEDYNAAPTPADKAALPLTPGSLGYKLQQAQNKVDTLVTTAGGGDYNVRYEEAIAKINEYNAKITSLEAKRDAAKPSERKTYQDEIDKLEGDREPHLNLQHAVDDLKANKAKADKVEITLQQAESTEKNALLTYATASGNADTAQKDLDNLANGSKPDDIEDKLLTYLKEGLYKESAAIFVDKEKAALNAQLDTFYDEQIARTQSKGRREILEQLRRGRYRRERGLRKIDPRRWFGRNIEYTDELNTDFSDITSNNPDAIKNIVEKMLNKAVSEGKMTAAEKAGAIADQQFMDQAAKDVVGGIVVAKRIKDGQFSEYDRGRVIDTIIEGGFGRQLAEDILNNPAIDEEYQKAVGEGETHDKKGWLRNNKSKVALMALAMVLGGPIMGIAGAYAIQMLYHHDQHKQEHPAVQPQY